MCYQIFRFVFSFLYNLTLVGVFILSLLKGLNSAVFQAHCYNLFVTPIHCCLLIIVYSMLFPVL